MFDVVAVVVVAVVRKKVVFKVFVYMMLKIGIEKKECKMES